MKTTSIPVDSSLKSVVHASYEEFWEAIETETVWFKGGEDPEELRACPPILDQLTCHRYESAEVLTLNARSPLDFQLLGDRVPAAFINYDGDQKAEIPLALAERELADSSCKLFYPHRRRGRGSLLTNNRAFISFVEFLVSDADRLRAYPVAQHPRVCDGGGGGMRAVFMLELIQDIEILEPLLLRSAMPDSIFDVVVSVSERILKSVHGPRITQFLDSLNLAWVNLRNPYEVNAILGLEKALLVNASESNLRGHDFVHHAVRCTPPRTISVTIQHGYECVGMRHHPVHDHDEGKQGVRFASDFILTWQTPDQLPSLNPMEAHKVIPVGLCKAFAEGSTLRHHEFFGNGSNQGSPMPDDSGNPKLLIAENLHSPRFSTEPSRYQRFLHFILDAQASPEVDLTVRSHPGKRTLEKAKKKNKFSFMEGTLTPERVSEYDLFVSPPSTILLDAVLAGVPSFVWSDAAHLGDLTNYDGMESVADFDESAKEVMLDRKVDRQLAGFHWLANNTLAFNGVPHAWNALINLTA